MKLTSVRVTMFRNILDSSDVAIQPDITCLVGKNESGKTAFLQALWRMKPARINPAFSVPDHYPAWLEKRHRNESRDLNSVTPVTALFRWEADDRAAVEKLFGPNVVPVDAQLSLSKSYSNEFTWTHGCDEGSAVSNLINSLTLPPTIATSLGKIESFQELGERIRAEQSSRKKSLAITSAWMSIAEGMNSLVGSRSFADVLWGIAFERIPEFFYFADYSKLPYTANIHHVLNAPEGKLSEADATVKSLLRLGGAEDEYLLNPDYERRKRELENVANALTDDVLKYWSQNSELRVQPEVTQTTERRGDGVHAVLNELKVRIWDNRHALSLPFNEHSTGFQWFFSFLAAFSEYEHRNPPVIILLDEPAVGLHARAQADFLRFIEERLSARCQVIYTTHSPFMVQPGHLERARTVEDQGREKGSTISSDVLSRDPDTLFPLQGALGYDLVQHLFIAEHNLVVEGTSDYTYLRVVSDFLADQPGRIPLDPRWNLVPVGGADAVPTFVALLGSHLNVTVVLDSRKEGHQRLSRLAAEGSLEQQRIILLGDMLGQKLADIEDLFTEEEYLRLYNRAFASSLTPGDLVGSDPIVSRIARHLGVARFDHGRPSDVILRERDQFLPTLSEDTLKRFEALFTRINITI